MANNEEGWLEILLRNFRHVPKIATCIVSEYCVFRYCFEYLKMEGPNPISPFTFAVFMTTLFVLAAVLTYLQKRSFRARRAKHKEENKADRPYISHGSLNSLLF